VSAAGLHVISKTFSNSRKCSRKKRLTQLLLVSKNNQAGHQEQIYYDSKVSVPLSPVLILLCSVMSNVIHKGLEMGLQICGHGMGPFGDIHLLGSIRWV
jgi:hypothetical protein